MKLRCGCEIEEKGKRVSLPSMMDDEDRSYGPAQFFGLVRV